MHSHLTDKMEPLDIVDLVPELSDLELAIFLSLVAREHCLIETKKDAIDDVAKELALVLPCCVPLKVVQDGSQRRV